MPRMCHATPNHHVRYIQHFSYTLLPHAGGWAQAGTVRRAAERRTQLDPALFVRGRDAVARGDVKAMIDADLAFHQALYRAAGNPLIEQSALLHWQHIRRAMGEALQSSVLREPVWDEHQAIAEAVARGDAEQAEALMRRHSEQASAHLAGDATQSRSLSQVVQVRAPLGATSPPTYCRMPAP